MTNDTSHKKHLMIVSMVSLAALLSIPAVTDRPTGKVEAFTSPLNNAAVLPQQIREGWGSQTGFRNAGTNVQRSLVSSVTNLSGQSSGQSVPRTDVSRGDWGVDTDGGDGQRMRSGIQIYHTWFWSRRTITRAQVRSQMVSAMGTTYTSTQRGQIADRVMQQYDLRAARGPFTIPANDRDTMTFLAIRKQCREWVSTKVLANAGSPRAYNTGVVSSPANYRPGMGLYKGTSHAMIITDIYWDRNGNPTRFRVAEANYGTGWTQNPPGMVPWLRTVGVGREIKTSDSYFSGCYVVSFG